MSVMYSCILTCGCAWPRFHRTHYLPFPYRQPHWTHSHRTDPLWCHQSWYASQSRLDYRGSHRYRQAWSSNLGDWRNLLHEHGSSQWQRWAIVWSPSSYEKNGYTHPDTSFPLLGVVIPPHGGIRPMQFNRLIFLVRKVCFIAGCSWQLSFWGFGIRNIWSLFVVWNFVCNFGRCGLRCLEDDGNGGYYRTEILSIRFELFFLLILLDPLLYCLSTYFIPLSYRSPVDSVFAVLCSFESQAHIVNMISAFHLTRRCDAKSVYSVMKPKGASSRCLLSTTVTAALNISSDHTFDPLSCCRCSISLPSSFFLASQLHEWRHGCLHHPVPAHHALLQALCSAPAHQAFSKHCATKTWSKVAVRDAIDYCVSHDGKFR